MTMQGKIQFEPVPFEEAAKMIRDRPAVTRAVFEKMIPEIRARSFLISGVEDMAVAQAVRDIIAELPRGASWDELKKQVEEKLRGPGGIPWLDEEGASKRATLLMRHHGFQGYAAAGYREMDEQREVFPYWQYLSMGDEKVRDSHAKLHGLILPANHPFWKDHYPPWDWGCRCQVVPVTEAEYLETVEAGRVAGKMALTGKIDEDFRTKTKGWALQKEGLKQLETMGRIDEGIGSTVDVSSPVQRARNPTEARAAYQWNPGDLSMPVSGLFDRYGKDAVQRDAFNAFFRNMQAATFLGADGKPRRVWDWAISSDMERNAKELLKKPIAKEKELLAVVDYKTGKRIAEKAGASHSVDFFEHAKKALLNEQPVVMVHNHIRSSGPSPADVSALFRFNSALKRIAVADADGTIHLVSAKTHVGNAGNLRVAKLLDRMMDDLDAGTMTEKQWADTLARLNRSGRITYDAK